MATSSAARRRARHQAALSVDTSNPVNWNHPLNDGLVSWWLPLPGRQGGDRLWDLCGRNHGTLTGGPTWVASIRPGGMGLSCDGSDDYVLTDSIPHLASAPAATLSGWMFRAATGTQTSFGLNVSNSNRFNIIWFTDNNIYVQKDTTFPAFASTAVGWHHVCQVFNGSATPKVLFYLDGAPRSLSGTITSNSTLNATANPLWVGREAANGFATGRYDDIRLYNRALSASEVLADYQQSRQGHPDTLRHWPRVTYFVPTSASGAIAGTASLVISDSAALTGDGALAATPSAVITSTALLAGDGVLAGATPLVITESAALTGGGTLASSASLALTTTALLVGNGFLAGTTTLAITESAVLVGAGVLAVAAPLALTTSAPLAGSGVLAGSATVALAGSVVLLGTGFLVSTTSTVFTVSAALTQAGGPITGTVSLVITTASVLVGNAALASAAAIALSTTATIGAVSVVTAVVEFNVRFPAVQESTAAFEHVQAHARRFPHVQPYKIEFVR